MVTRYYGPKDLHRMHHIPIYDVGWEVVVCHDIRKARNTPERVKRLGRCDDLANVSGLQSYKNRHHSIFLLRQMLTYDIIAHEIFHSTHRIMEWIEADIGEDFHEPHAYLNGYLTALFYEDLKRWGLRVGIRAWSPRER